MEERWEIPVVDLAAFPAELSKLLAACEGPGCFWVVNHGIPAALQAEMKATVRFLHDLPDELKLQNRDVIPGSGYRLPSADNPLYQAFGLVDASSVADIEAFCSHLQASIHHRETIKSYARKLHGLAADIACKIAESMGLGGCSFEDWPCQFRLNKYNFTEETLGSSGVCIHTDSGFLTVLQPDDSVGGLEVMNNTGSFVGVDPVPGSLFINMGDIAKAWSNGRLHNLKHRVQCKEGAVRFSIALFLLAPKDGMVEPPALLVDSEHPRLYRSFAYDDYRKLFVSSKLVDGGALLPFILS